MSGDFPISHCAARPVTTGGSATSSPPTGPWSAEQAGITGNITMPWMFYTGPDSTLAQKVDGMKRFRDDMKLDA